MLQSVVDIKEIEKGVVQLSMQDRTNKNTLSEELTISLLESFELIEKNLNYKVVILTGYDNYFCSGGTKDGLLGIQEGKGKFTDSKSLYSLPLDCRIPVIAAMQGHGIGGGFALGLFSDFVILSRESVYTTNFMKYGFTPGMGATYIFPKKLGISLAEELLLGANSYQGEELKKRGIPFPVLPREEVLPHAYEVAHSLAEKPRISLITLKDHLVNTLREELPKVIEQEVKMHEITFHQPEVKELILKLYGK
jgi:polyketide biosynthesis enoyl-CoA hydratase PksI